MKRCVKCHDKDRVLGEQSRGTQPFQMWQEVSLSEI